MALRFVGSAIATMSELPVRDTGSTLCRSQGSLGTSLRISASISYSSRLTVGTRYCWLRKLVISSSRDVAELGERVAEVLPGLLLLFLRLPKLRERDELLADEELAQPVVVRHARP